MSASAEFDGGLRGRSIGGRYRIEQLLGSGSSGVVVAARHVYLQRRVTVKILHPATSAGERAQKRHVHIRHQAAALRSRHVARPIDMGTTADGAPFIVTEHLRGRTLADELERRGKLPIDEAVRWILQACEALAEAHAAGIIHGDLKPRNLFLAIEPPPSPTIPPVVLKVLDFGMTTPLDDGGDDEATTWFTSPAYLAPEQIVDPAALSPQTDIWALGVILHELLVGALPFTAESVAGMLMAVTSDEPRLDELAFATSVLDERSSELIGIVARCLAKEPCARPTDVVSLAWALAPFTNDGTLLAAKVEAARLRGGDLASAALPPPELELAESDPPEPEPRSRRFADTAPRSRPVRRMARDGRRSRRAILLATAMVLAGAAAVAMPKRRLGQRALRDLVEDPPVVDGGSSTPSERLVLAAQPAPPPPPIETAAPPALAPPPATATAKRRARVPNGFTHPSQLDHRH